MLSSRNKVFYNEINTIIYRLRFLLSLQPKPLLTHDWYRIQHHQVKNKRNIATFFARMHASS